MREEIKTLNDQLAAEPRKWKLEGNALRHYLDTLVFNKQMKINT